MNMDNVAPLFPKTLATGSSPDGCEINPKNLGNEERALTYIVPSIITQS